MSRVENRYKNGFDGYLGILEKLGKGSWI